MENFMVAMVNVEIAVAADRISWGRFALAWLILECGLACERLLPLACKELAGEWGVEPEIVGLCAALSTVELFRQHKLAD